MSEHKFCIDCVHFRRIDLGPFTTKVVEECRHPSAPRNHVTGHFPGALEQRLSVLHCGPDGTRWQRKPAQAPQPPPNGWWPPRRRRILWFWPW